MLSPDVRQRFADSYVAKGLSEDEITALEPLLTEVEFSEGEPVFKLFDEGHDLFVVLEGKAGVRATNGDLMAWVRPGHVFGEIGLLDHRPRSATVIAETPIRLLRLHSQGFDQLLEAGHPAAAKLHRNVARVVCERIRSANLQIEALLLATGMDI